MALLSFFLLQTNDKKKDQNIKIILEKSEYKNLNPYALSRFNQRNKFVVVYLQRIIDSGPSRLTRISNMPKRYRISEDILRRSPGTLTANCSPPAPTTTRSNCSKTTREKATGPVKPPSKVTNPRSGASSSTRPATDSLRAATT